MSLLLLLADAAESGSAVLLGGTITFASGQSWDGNGWRTAQQLADGKSVSFTRTHLSPYIVFGVSTDLGPTLSWNEIDCGIQIPNSTTLRFYTNDGTFNELPDTPTELGDTLSFHLSGTTLTAKLNGTTVKVWSGISLPVYAWALAYTIDESITIFIGAINGVQPTEGASANATFTPV